MLGLLLPSALRPLWPAHRRDCAIRRAILQIMRFAATTTSFTQAQAQSTQLLLWTLSNVSSMTSDDAIARRDTLQYKVARDRKTNQAVLCLSATIINYLRPVSPFTHITRNFVHTLAAATSASRSSHPNDADPQAYHSAFCCQACLPALHAPAPQPLGVPGAAPPAPHCCCCSRWRGTPTVR